jgi:hypothetical protein
LVVNAIQCLFGISGSSNAALAFSIDGNTFEIFANDLWLNGELQSRVNGITTLPDGTTIERADGGIEVVKGAVVVDSRIHYNGGGDQPARVGYWLNIKLKAPIPSLTSPELTGLCATVVRPNGDFPMRPPAESLFVPSSTRFQTVIDLCGLDVVPPPTCQPPGTTGCCPAYEDNLGPAEDLCDFAKCDALAYSNCLYDCCLSGDSVCVESYVDVVACSPPAPPPSPPSSPPVPADQPSPPSPPSPPPSPTPASVSECESIGDPHFTTWTGATYSYQGKASAVAPSGC